MSKREHVHHPDHYGGDSPYEVIKVLDAWQLGFRLGNAVKYIARADKKGRKAEDLAKASWYVLRERAIAEGREPDFYNDLLKAVAVKGATKVTRVRLGSPPPGAKLVASVDLTGCQNCARPSMPSGTCHACGRKWGACAGAATEEPSRRELRAEGKAPCDDPECEMEAAAEWEGFNLCTGHRELVPIMPPSALDRMRRAKAKAELVRASGHFKDAKQHFKEAAEGWDKERENHRRQVGDLEGKLVAARAAQHRAELLLANSSSKIQELEGVLEQQAMDSAKAEDDLREKVREAHARVPREVGLALFRSSEIVEKAYGRCRASEQIRAMGGDALAIRPLAAPEASCLGCKGGSVTHTCGREPDADRCDRCLARRSTVVHDCEKMGTPRDHYVSFLENELRELRDAMVNEFEVVPHNGAVPAALKMIRGLLGERAANRLVGAAKAESWSTEHQERVERMMKGFGQEVPVKPTDQKPETRVLRARLILEECLETIWDGLRVNVSLVWKGTAPDTGKPTGCRHHVRFEALEFESYGEGADLVELADGCADISVVTIGTLSAFGIKDRPLLEEVDANNQAKIDTGKTDEHGKFVKHPDHRPPDIGGVLNQQGWTNARTAAF